MDMSLVNSIIVNSVESFYNFVIIDKHEKVVYINKTYAELLGTSQEEASGKDVVDVIPNTTLPQILKSGVEDIGHIFKVYNHVTKKEQTHVCNRYPLFENGQVVGVLAITVFSDSKEVEELQRELDFLKQKNEIYKNQLNELRDNKYNRINLLGKSKKMEELKELVYDVADSKLPILLMGETGVGKEVFANIIHQLSSRRENDFVKINCAAIPKDLLESELFGYEKGAFSGASERGKIGRFELANNGTILLDEISEMHMDLQVKLLRVLQEQEINRVGGLGTIKLNIRLLCSTNKDVKELVRQGKFREDLYYRINTVEMVIPPLRERLVDLPLLCDHFIKKANRENDLMITGIEDQVISLFEEYEWPGNIRELENAIDRACVITKSGKLKASQFDFLFTSWNKGKGVSNERLKDILHREDILELLLENLSEKENTKKSRVLPLEEIKERTERQEIIKALEKAGGNKTKAAKMLNVDRSVLYSKINKYKIDL